MDESKLSVDKTTYQDIFRIRHCLKYRKDMMTFRVSPPASFDGLADDHLGKSGNGALGRCQDYPMLSDKGDCLHGGHAFFPGACASVLWQCKDKSDLTIWFDLAGVAKAE